MLNRQERQQRLWMIIFMVAFIALKRGAHVSAQELTTFGENQAAVAFPNTVDFTLSYTGAEPVSAVLTYDVDKFSCVEVSADVPIIPDGDGTVEWQWVMNRSGNPPPGTDVTWQWTLTDAAGNVTTTEPQTVTLNDERHDWQTVATERITLHWYRGDIGQTLLESAEAGLARLENEMGIELATNAEFWIYGSASEMRDAVLFISDWAGGVAFTEYNTILIGVAPNNIEWGRRTVAHELAHLVLGQFGRSCVGGARPTWLEEGLATVAEGEPESITLSDLQRGIDDNIFAPIRSLTGAFPAHGSGAQIAYSQSYSIVDFLLDTYGADKMQQLILNLAEGESYDDALQLVYGLNMDGLETKWRTSLGAPAREIPPTLTPIVAAAVPTYPPISAAQDMPTPDTFSGTPFPATPTSLTDLAPTDAAPSAIVTTETPLSVEPTIAATETPIAVAEIVENEPTDTLTQTTPPERENKLILWAVVGLLLIIITGLFAFILKPRQE